MHPRIGILLLLCCAISACGRSLNSLEGPDQGWVSGLICKQLPTLTAALEMPTSQSALIGAGHCVRLAYGQQVAVLRTIMMPGDGKYSQFTIALDGEEATMWIKTSELRPA